MYLSVKEIAKMWKVSERSVRNYCACGLVEGAYLVGKTWNIPQGAQKPSRKNASQGKSHFLLSRMKEEMQGKTSGGIYHKVQVDLTYNSSRIEGTKLSEEETRYIFETNTIGCESKVHNVDDIIETSNHFRCIDFVIQHASQQLSHKMIKQLHSILKSGTSDSRKEWFNVGEYKKLPNQVGGKNTTPPEDVEFELGELLNSYNNEKNKTIDDIIDFHYNFEIIHPFQDGNGRIGRLIAFKECLKNDIVPFILQDEYKIYYYRGLAEWQNERGYLKETCLFAQDLFKQSLDYFKIEYNKRK